MFSGSRVRTTTCLAPRLTLAFVALAGTTLPAATAQEDASLPPASGPPAAPRGEDFAPPEEFVNVDGISTHFVARGDGHPAIVLIHGFGSNTYTWRKNLDGLADRFRVVAVDLKGFGLTEKPRDGQYHTAAYARHLEGFLDALKLERPILVGNSMGGAVALHLALTNPERVAGLVLVDSALPGSAPPRLDPPGEPVEAAEQAPATRPAGLRLRPNPLLLRALITRPMIERGLRSSFRDPAIVTPEMIDAYFIPTTLDGAMEALAAMMNPPPEAFVPLPPLESLRLPTLVVWGRHDRVIPVSVADVLSKRIPGARQVIFEDAGHLPHEERPDAFNDVLARFADEID